MFISISSIPTLYDFNLDKRNENLDIGSRLSVLSTVAGCANIGVVCINIHKNKLLYFLIICLHFRVEISVFLSDLLVLMCIVGIGGNS